MQNPNYHEELKNEILQFLFKHGVVIKCINTYGPVDKRTIEAAALFVKEIGSASYMFTVKPEMLMTLKQGIGNECGLMAYELLPLGKKVTLNNLGITIHETDYNLN